MKLNLTKNLRSIPLLNAMEQMLLKYESNLDEVTLEQVTYDAVKQFIEITHMETQNIDYLTQLFYSSKGTILVMEYMQKFLNMELTYEYDGESLDLDIIMITTSDPTDVYNKLYLFLNTLLYFHEIDLIFQELKYIIIGTLKEKIDVNEFVYNEFELNFI